MLGKSFGAERARIYGMRRIAAHGHRAAILYADEHAATDRAIAAGSGHPTVRNLPRGGVADGLVGCIGILFRENVEAEIALQAHAARC